MFPKLIEGRLKALLFIFIIIIMEKVNNRDLNLRFIEIASTKYGHLKV